MFLFKLELNLSSWVDTLAYYRHQTYRGSFFLYNLFFFLFLGAILYQNCQLKLLHEEITKVLSNHSLKNNLNFGNKLVAIKGTKKKVKTSDKFHF